MERPCPYFVNFEQISHNVLLLSLLTLNMEMPTGKKQLHDWLKVKDINAILFLFFWKTTLLTWKHLKTLKNLKILDAFKKDLRLKPAGNILSDMWYWHFCTFHTRKNRFYAILFNWFFSRTRTCDLIVALIVLYMSCESVDRRFMSFWKCFSKIFQNLEISNSEI